MSLRQPRRRRLSLLISARIHRILYFLKTTPKSGLRSVAVGYLAQQSVGWSICGQVNAICGLVFSTLPLKLENRSLLFPDWKHQTKTQKVQKSILQSDVQSKADKSPVTIADYGSQVIVSFVLKMELPSQSFSMVAEEDSGDLRKDGAHETLRRITKHVNETLLTDGTYNVLLSEEDVLDAIDSGKSEGGLSGRHWVLDPIDGTKGFVRGDQYAIALALLNEGKVVLGVLACPNLPLTPISSTYKHSSNGEVGCLFSARIGSGAIMQSLDGFKSAKVHVSSIETPADASFFESFEAAHSLHDLSYSIAKKLGVQASPVRIDSQAKYGALARGDGAIYLRFPHKGYREKIWDHAAGFIVVTEAGGIVTDAAGNDLDFSRGRYLDLDTGIICTNKRLMPLLLKAVQASIKENLQSPSTL